MGFQGVVNPRKSVSCCFYRTYFGVLIPPYGGSNPSTPAIFCGGSDSSPANIELRPMSQGNEFDSLTIAVFTGKANPALAQEITRHLHVPLGRAHVGRFSDGEVNVELMENVRGRDVFIVQPTNPPAENLMELLMMTDACRRASAKRVTAVVPYFGYGRQDRRPRATRVAITAKLVANMIASAGVDRLLTVDLHA